MGPIMTLMFSVFFQPNGHIPSQPVTYDNPSFTNDNIGPPPAPSKHHFSNAVHPMPSQPPSQFHPQPTDGYTSLVFDAAVLAPSTSLGPPHSPPERDLNGPTRTSPPERDLNGPIWTKSRSHLSLVDTMSESSTDREIEPRKSNLTRSDSKSDPVRRKINKGSYLDAGDDEIDAAEKAQESNKDNPHLATSVREELERLAQNRTGLDLKSSAIAWVHILMLE